MSLRRLASTLAGAFALAGIAYTILAIRSVRAFGSELPAEGDALPATILVPLHGAEPGLETRLRAFVNQDVTEHQVVFGVGDANDGARAVAERVAATSPGRHVDVSVGLAANVANPKIANLSSMIGLAVHPVIVLIDCDMHVDPSYLRAVTAPLRAVSTGVVTCLYAGVPDARLTSRLGAMFITEAFAPSALLERRFVPLAHCFGATMALRRPVLEAIGGLKALGPHLADDHVLGRLVTERGFDVVLSRYVVKNDVSEPTASDLWQHELRWHRTIRALQPFGYAFLFVTYPVPLALLAFAFARRRRRSGMLVALAVALRLALGRVASRTLGVEPAPFWLVPVRDLLGVAVWFAGLRGTKVRWRGDDLAIATEDRLARPNTRG